MCPGSVITNSYLVMTKETQYCATCQPYVEKRLRSKALEQEIMDECCKGAEHCSSVYFKIRKEQKKDGLIVFGTPRRKLKNRIQHRINVLQERQSISKEIKSLEDFKNNIGDFKKHFDDEVFLDFTNIEEEENEEKQMMIYCSGWAQDLLSTTNHIFLDGTFKKVS